MDEGREMRGSQVLLLAAAGGLAGIAAWLVVDRLPGLGLAPRAELGLAALTTLFFAALLALLGPLRPRDAILGALVLALPSTGLLLLGSLRFDDMRRYLDSGHPIIATAIPVLVALPFLVSAFRIDQGWARYEAVFDNAWDLLARLVAAATFAIAVLALLLLCDRLLQLVGIDAIASALRQAPVRYLLAGLSVGAALGMAWELRVSPRLALRLLRLLLPVALVVVAVFLAALALRGAEALDALFGTFSAAGTLIAMGLAALVLITAAVEAGPAREPRWRILRLATAALALVLPVLAGLALAAVLIRVRQYGWTPDRLAALLAAAVLCGYGLFHGLGVLAGRGWTGRIRRGNLVMAALVLLLAVLWQTPPLNPQRISARSLERRILAAGGEADPEDLARLQADWGKSGRAALARLEGASTPGAARLAERIAAVRAQAPGPDGEVPPAQERQRILDELLAGLVVRPEGAEPDPALFDPVGTAALEQARRGCLLRTPDGHPGCVLVLADFLTERPGDEGMLFHLTRIGAVEALGLSGGGRLPRFSRPLVLGGEGRDLSPALLDRLQEAPIDLAPAPLTVLNAGRQGLVLLP